MKTSASICAASAILGALGVIASAQSGDAGAKPPAVRVGTYDSRAIAVAYAASTFNPVREKMKEYEAAKNAGDAEKMAALEAWGKNRQRMLHFQGFGRVPVDDLLEPVQEGVARIAADEQLAMIAMACTFAAEGVEVVDVTDQLVELFQPTEKTRATVRQVREAEPMSLVALADLPAEQ